MVIRDVFAIHNEVFSDGSNVSDRYTIKQPIINQVPQEWITRIRDSTPGRRILANPGAAEVWLMERQNGAPWRERAERLQQVEDEKAKKELFQKKLSLLAKQTSAGLATVYNAHFESSELVPLLQDAAKQVQRGDAAPEAAALLKSVQRFDVKTVSNLLKCYDTTAKKGPPNLSITTRCHLRPKP
jgi:hypothetical protein